MSRVVVPGKIDNYSLSLLFATVSPVGRYISVEHISTLGWSVVGLGQDHLSTRVLTSNLKLDAPLITIKILQREYLRTLSMTLYRYIIFRNSPYLEEHSIQPGHYCEFRLPTAKCN